MEANVSCEFHSHESVLCSLDGDWYSEIHQDDLKPYAVNELVKHIHQSIRAKRGSAIKSDPNQQTQPYLFGHLEETVSTFYSNTELVCSSGEAVLMNSVSSAQQACPCLSPYNQLNRAHPESWRLSWIWLIDRISGNLLGTQTVGDSALWPARLCSPSSWLSRVAFPALIHFQEASELVNQNTPANCLLCADDSAGINGTLEFYNLTLSIQPWK